MEQIEGVKMDNRPRIKGDYLALTGGGDDGTKSWEQEFDATRHVLNMPLETIQNIQYDIWTTDEIGKNHVEHDGPCDVYIEDQILEFFDVEDSQEITQSMLDAKREAYSDLLAGSVQKLCQFRVEVRVNEADLDTFSEAMTQKLTETLSDYKGGEFVSRSLVFAVADE